MKIERKQSENLRLQISMEDVCLSGGFKVLLEISSGTDLQYPISEEGLKAAQDIAGRLNSKYYL